MRQIVLGLLIPGATSTEQNRHLAEKSTKNCIHFRRVVTRQICVSPHYDESVLQRPAVLNSHRDVFTTAIFSFVLCSFVCFLVPVSPSSSGSVCLKVIGFIFLIYVFPTQLRQIRFFTKSVCGKL